MYHRVSIGMVNRKALAIKPALFAYIDGDGRWEAQKILKTAAAESRKRVALVYGGACGLQNLSLFDGPFSFFAHCINRSTCMHTDTHMHAYISPHVHIHT
jgi:hypothetical protein